MYSLIQIIDEICAEYRIFATFENKADAECYQSMYNHSVVWNDDRLYLLYDGTHREYPIYLEDGTIRATFARKEDADHAQANEFNHLDK